MAVSTYAPSRKTVPQTRLAPRTSQIRLPYHLTASVCSSSVANTIVAPSAACTLCWYFIIAV